MDEGERVRSEPRSFMRREGLESESVDNDQSNEKRKRGDDLKIMQRLNPDPTKFFQVTHRGDSVDHRAKDDRCDDHLDQIHVHERIGPDYDRLRTLLRSRREFAMTDTLLSDIARLAIIGLSRRPNNG